MFVIGYTGDDGNGYYAVDRDTGYGYCTDHLQSARFFNTKEEAINLIEKDSDFNRINKFTDNSTAPPRMIWAAAGICNTRTKGKVTFQVIEINLNTIWFKNFEGELTN